MKKLSMLLVLVLVAALLTTPSLAEGTTYTQAPMLDAKVEGGELPPRRRTPSRRTPGSSPRRSKLRGIFHGLSDRQIRRNHEVRP